MRSQEISIDKILRFAVTCIVASCVAAILFLVFHSWRGPTGGSGIMLSLFGSSVAIWFAIRAGDRRLMITAFVSALPLAFWVWVIYDVVHVSAA